MYFYINGRILRSNLRLYDPRFCTPSPIPCKSQTFTTMILYSTWIMFAVCEKHVLEGPWVYEKYVSVIQIKLKASTKNVALNWSSYKCKFLFFFFEKSNIDLKSWNNNLYIKTIWSCMSVFIPANEQNMLMEPCSRTKVIRSFFFRVQIKRRLKAETIWVIPFY